jgi:uncharacterized RDD family membrane protein YckC
MIQTILPFSALWFSFVAAIATGSGKKPGRQRIATQASRDDLCFSAQRMQS